MDDNERTGMLFNVLISFARAWTEHQAVVQFLNGMRDAVEDEKYIQAALAGAIQDGLTKNEWPWS